MLFLGGAQRHRLLKKDGTVEQTPTSEILNGWDSALGPLDDIVELTPLYHNQNNDNAQRNVR